MTRAMLMLLDQPNKHREADAFAAGLREHGYSVHNAIPDPKRGDLLLIWNRMGKHHSEARRFEAAGARVIVAENGYLGAEWRGQRWFAMSVGHHNGAGRWPVGGPERWDSWGVELAPMRDLGGETVMLAQRGIGEQALRAPERWTDQTARQYGARLRRHPGTRKDGISLEQDLRGASAVVTWSSGAALKALVMGCHCWHGMPRWIGAPAATRVGAPLNLNDRRLPMFQRLAWAMWSEAEAASGVAFGGLLRC